MDVSLSVFLILVSLTIAPLVLGITALVLALIAFGIFAAFILKGVLG